MYVHVLMRNTSVASPKNTMMLVIFTFRHHVGWPKKEKNPPPPPFCSSTSNYGFHLQYLRLYVLVGNQLMGTKVARWQRFTAKKRIRKSRKHFVGLSRNTKFTNPFLLGDSTKKVILFILLSVTECNEWSGRGLIGMYVRSRPISCADF